MNGIWIILPVRSPYRCCETHFGNVLHLEQVGIQEILLTQPPAWMPSTPSTPSLVCIKLAGGSSGRSAVQQCCMTLAAYKLPHTQVNCLEVDQGAPGAHRHQRRLSKEDKVPWHAGTTATTINKCSCHLPSGQGLITLTVPPCSLVHTHVNIPRRPVYVRTVLAKEHTTQY